MCKCCGVKEPAGYIGSGIYLEDLYRRCWKRHAPQNTNKINLGYHSNEGKS